MTFKQRKDQRAEVIAEISKNLEKVLALGGGDVGVRVRTTGGRVLLFSYCCLRKKLSQAQASSEFLAALASILARRPFGFVNLEIEGDSVYLSFSILKKYEMPATDAGLRGSETNGSESLSRR